MKPQQRAIDLSSAHELSTADGSRYLVLPFGTKQAMKVGARIATVIAPFAGAAGAVFAGLLKGHKLDKASILKAVSETDESVFASSLTRAIGSLDGDSLVWLIEAFAGNTWWTNPEGTELQLSAIADAHFVGRLNIMVEWLVFAIDANYASFWPGAGDTPPAPNAEQ